MRRCWRGGRERGEIGWGKLHHLSQGRNWDWYALAIGYVHNGRLDGQYAIRRREFRGSEAEGVFRLHVSRRGWGCQAMIVQCCRSRDCRPRVSSMDPRLVARRIRSQHQGDVFGRYAIHTIQQRRCIIQNVRRNVEEGVQIRRAIHFSKVGLWGNRTVTFMNARHYAE